MNVRPQILAENTQKILPPLLLCRCVLSPSLSSPLPPNRSVSPQPLSRFLFFVFVFYTQISIIFRIKPDWSFSGLLLPFYYHYWCYYYCSQDVPLPFWNFICFSIQNPIYTVHQNQVPQKLRFGFLYKILYINQNKFKRKTVSEAGTHLPLCTGKAWCNASWLPNGLTNALLCVPQVVTKVRPEVLLGLSGAGRIWSPETIMVRHAWVQ